MFLKNGLLSIFFSTQCAGCKRYIKDFKYLYLCEECFEKISAPQAPFCQRCHKPLNNAVTQECHECGERKNHFSYSRSAGIYSDSLREALHMFKFEAKKGFIRVLGEYMIKNIDPVIFAGVDFIIPVPVSRATLGEREYNQTELLADYLGKKYKLSVKKSVVKIKETARQSTLERQQRLTNLRGAFKVDSKALTLVAGKVVVVVDDIYTTGSTINEMAKILKKAGALEVRAVTLARAV
ncbi:MAG: ComF family protein [bacterium]